MENTNVTDNEIEQYLSGLPTSVLKVVQDTVWQKRVTEIAIKYSLNNEQTTTLQNLTLFVVIGVEDAGTFAQSIETELGISKLLTEQVVKDLDERVFQYVFKAVSETPAPKTATPKPVEAKMESKPAPQPASTIPEMRPDMSPMVEKEHPLEKKTFAPENMQTKASEMVQKPVAVPRYMPEEKPTAAFVVTQEKPEVKSIVDAKLSGSVKMEPSAGQKPGTKPETKYSVDPYREPIQ